MDPFVAWSRFFGRILLWLLVAAAVVYVGDWAVWRVRVARGGGIGHVTVGLLQVVPIKGNKEEYFPDGTEVVDCSQSIFPQTGAGACWWVQTHRTVYER
jgi:hypothetical protein